MRTKLAVGRAVLVVMGVVSLILPGGTPALSIAVIALGCSVVAGGRNIGEINTLRYAEKESTCA